MRMFWAFARNPSHAGEQTPVLFPGELLPIDIYDVHDSFLSQSISPHSATSSPDSRTLTTTVNPLCSNIWISATCCNAMTDKTPPAHAFSATQVM